MNWLEIISAGIAGGLAAGIASIFPGKSKERRGPFVVATVVLFFGLQFLSNQAILPRVRAWQVDRQLRELPYYRDIAEIDPQTYDKIRTMILDSVKKGEGADAIAKRITSVVAGTVPKFIGTASDDSVASFIDIATFDVEELLRTPSDACYYFLFPQEKGAPSVSNYFDEKTRVKMLDVLGRLVHSAVRNPQPLPDAAKAQALLVPVVDRLQNEYGNDVLLIQQEPSDTTGRRKVCAMTISLYKNIKDLPQSDASLLTRYLLSDQKSGQTAK